MTGMKHCPKCGSTNINFLVFYRPSTWKCLDCGYEGAFIVEDSRLPEGIKERYRNRYNSVDWIERESCIDDRDGSTGAQEKLLEDHTNIGVTGVEDASAGLDP
jgi:hypothetical protein